MAVAPFRLAPGGSRVPRKRAQPRKSLTRGDTTKGAGGSRDRPKGPTTAGVTDIRDHDANSPFGHVCTPEEVAEAVRFVVTAGYVNDQRIVVDGGTF